MSLKERFAAFQARFKLTSHHAIERFGITIAVLIASLAVVATGTTVSAFSTKSTERENTALYTGEFTTSKTGRAGKTAGVFTNEDKSRALVLMKFDAPDQMPKDSKQYKAFVTGLSFSGSKQYITQPLSGETVIFGSTGIMGVVVTSNKPLENMIYQLSIRNKADITTGEEKMSQEEIDTRYGGDDTFAQYEQWRIGFNPAAKEAETLAALNTTTLDPAKIFAEIVMHPKEKELRDAAEKGIEKLKADLNKIQTLEQTLQQTKVDNISVALPPTPKYIAGDKVTGNESTREDHEGSTLELETQTVFPGGWNFDWRSGSIEQGYLDDIVPSGESYVDFLDHHAKQETSGDESLPVQKWKLSNGKELTDDIAGGALQPLVDAKTELEEAYTTYVHDKREYQVTTLGDIIKLEVEMRGVESASSVNTSAEDFEVY